MLPIVLNASQCSWRPVSQYQPCVFTAFNQINLSKKPESLPRSSNDRETMFQDRSLLVMYFEAQIQQTICFFEFKVYIRKQYTLITKF